MCVKCIQRCNDIFPCTFFDCSVMFSMKRAGELNPVVTVKYSNISSSPLVILCPKSGEIRLLRLGKALS